MCECTHDASIHSHITNRCLKYKCPCGWAKELGGNKMDGSFGDDYSTLTQEELQEMLADIASDKKDGKKESKLVCHKCGADEATAGKLTGVIGGRIVAIGVENSVIECYDTKPCWERVDKKKGHHVSKNDSYSSGGYSGSLVSITKCRHEASEAFSIGSLHFYGGSESKIENQVFDPTKWFIISLLGSSYKSEKVMKYRHAEWATALDPYRASTADITIDWTDMQAPPLRPGFWMKLFEVIKGTGQKNVLFYCIGGHGRTGTALSSVLIECADLKPKDAVEFVRKTYCPEAVETKSQTDYLVLLYDVKREAAIQAKKLAKMAQKGEKKS